MTQSTSSQPPCPYAVLSVPRDATSQQIKSSYRKLALRYHPDKQRTDEDRRRSTEAFTRVSNAYEILSDEGRRREYDLYGHGGRPTRAAEARTRGGNGGAPAAAAAARSRPGGEAEGSASFRESFFASGAAGGGHPFDDPFFRSSSSGMSGGGFADPFDLFERVFGEEFGTIGGHFSRGGRPSAGRSRREGVGGGGGRGFFDHDPFAEDPFFSGMGMGMGMGGSGFGSMSSMMSSMSRQMDAMSQGMGMGGTMAHHHSLGNSMGRIGPSSGMRHHNAAGGGHHQSFSMSSSSGYGGASESVSTTTRIVNGQRHTVTERTVVRPDGTVERRVETSSGGGSGRGHHGFISNY